MPQNADRLLHALGPLIGLFPALVTFAVIPFGDDLCFGKTPAGGADFSAFGAMAHGGVCTGTTVSLQIADLNVGILYVFAIAGTGIVAPRSRAGRATTNSSVLGGLRATSQMVSYEVAIGLSLVGAFMIYGSAAPR